MTWLRKPQPTTCGESNGRRKRKIKRRGRIRF
jgi:hypothetical protein